jgi:hypothetical protein
LDCSFYAKDIRRKLKMFSSDEPTAVVRLLDDHSHRIQSVSTNRSRLVRRMSVQGSMLCLQISAGGCYDYKFMRFSVIFCEKIGVLKNTEPTIKFWHNLARF